MSPKTGATRPEISRIASQQRENEASCSELILMFIIAVALRVAVFITSAIVYNVSVFEYAEKADGKSYLRMAQLICFEQPPILREYDFRVFPGYPAMIAVVHTVGIPVEWSALLISWLSGGVSAVFGAMLFRERRIGWALVTLTPQFVLNGSMAMSEAPFMAMTLASLYFGIRDNSLRCTLVGGLLAGMAGVIRPMACFAVIGLIAFKWRHRKSSHGIAFGAAAALVVLVAMGIMHLITGNAMRGVQIYSDHDWAYRGEMFSWPFHSIIRTLLAGDQHPLKVAYILLHVPLALAACVIVGCRWIRSNKEHESLSWLCGPWLFGNTLFVLCVGSVWGFLCFQRMILVALPPMIWAFLPILPRSYWAWFGFGCLSFAGAVFIWPSGG